MLSKHIRNSMYRKLKAQQWQLRVKFIRIILGNHTFKFSLFIAVSMMVSHDLFRELFINNKTSVAIKSKF